MRKPIQLLVLIFTTAFMFLAVIFSNDVCLAAKSAVTICAVKVIPSLLPIMIIALLFVKLNLFNALPKKARPFLLLYISLIGGYPIGVKIINQMSKDGLVDKFKAEKILYSLINAGPAFIIAFIGENLLLNKELGILLFFSQIITSIIFYIIFGGFTLLIKTVNNDNISFNKIGDTLTDSINSISSICVYVLIFSVLSKILSKFINNKYLTVIMPLLEITTGVLNCKNIYYLSFYLSFCGLCVLMQIITIASAINISIIKLFISRIIHGILSTTILKLLVLIFKPSFNVISNNASLCYSTSGSIYYVILLCFSLIVFLNSLNNKKVVEFYK